ncbi:MAG: putative repeat protein (TIGR03833 family) [Bacteroidia bacterium]
MGWLYSYQGEIIQHTDSIGVHYTYDNRVEINQPNNKCTLFYYGCPFLLNDTIPIDENTIEAVQYYDSMTKVRQFEIRITPKIAKSLVTSYKKNLDFHQYPFKIDGDTIAILEPEVLPTSNEIDFMCDGIGATFSCMIVYDNNDTVWHGISGNYDLSNSMYLDTTLPIYCLLQQYPDLFVRHNYFGSLNSKNIDEIIFRFIRWQKDKEEMTDGTIRKNIEIGSEVEVVEKHNQRSGVLTDGFVERILTKSSNHPHGIKVLLETGEVGRVKRVLAEPLADID